MERVTKKVTVFDEEKYGGNGWPSDNLVEFIAWAQEKLNQVPEEFRDKVQIDIDSVSGYEDSHEPSMKIYYYRPETDDEFNHRLKNEEIMAQKARDKELWMLEQLKKKYEPKE